jgi:NAD(P)-dependent dehydrogenase (short-subunit alcohol dehydrogenase family)
MAEGNVVVVTGAAGGLGSETVRALAKGGASVLAVDLAEEAVEQLAADTAGLAGQVVAHTADAADASDVEGFIARAGKELGPLTALFNNAAIEGAIAPITEYSEEEYDRVMHVNAKSVWLGMKYGIPALEKSGGGIILNTASTGGMVGWPGLSGYVASKHAVVGMTRVGALENAGNGIRVNTLCPGPMDTRMIWSIGEVMVPGDRAEQKKQLEATVPVGRLGQPAEVAAFATWLLTECPEYLTGAVLPIDGAQTTG